MVKEAHKNNDLPITSTLLSKPNDITKTPTNLLSYHNHLSTNQLPTTNLKNETSK
jgi:hypothetical protein